MNPDTSAGRIRVLYLIDSLGPGGAEQTLARIVPRIDRDSFDPVVAVLQTRGDDAVARSMRQGGIQVDTVPVDRLRSPSGHLRLYRYLGSVRPDVVHTHLEFAHTLGGIYSRLRGIPAIATVHTFAEGRNEREDKRLSLMWWSLRHAHKVVIAPSAAGRQYFERVGRIDGPKMTVMANGIDLEEFRPGGRSELRRELGIAEDASVLLTVAVLRRDKGIADLLEAMPRIQADFPRATALIVGDGPERTALRRRAELLGVEESVVFTGRRNDVAELMRIGDLFVLPTHEDVLPTVVAEAMGSGLPVVASDVGGLSEMVKDGTTGILFPPGSIDSLVDICSALLVDEKARADLGHAGRERAEVRFDLLAQVRHLEEIYRTVVG